MNLSNISPIMEFQALLQTGEETFADFRGFSVTIKLHRWMDGYVILQYPISVSKSK